MDVVTGGCYNFNKLTKQLNTHAVISILYFYSGDLESENPERGEFVKFEVALQAVTQSTYDHIKSL